MRHYGMNCRIVLYHFGGLAIPDSFGAWNAARQRQPGAKESIFISAAGPGLQLLLALIVWSLGIALGIRMELSGWIEWLAGKTIGNSELPGSAVVYAAFDAILYPSTVWALLNLAPIIPLDGGQIMRNALVLTNTADPIRTAHLVSIGVAVLIGIYFMQTGELFGIMFLLLAANNWQALQSGGRGF
jgi:membrane-associated protease RseP (regulator of RpoE activity)